MLRAPSHSKPLAESSNVLKLYKRGACNLFQLLCQARFPSFPSLGKSGAKTMAAFRLLDELTHQQRLRTDKYSMEALRIAHDRTFITRATRNGWSHHCPSGLYQNPTPAPGWNVNSPDTINLQLFQTASFDLFYFLIESTFYTQDFTGILLREF